MSEKSFSRQLNKEAKLREELLDDALKSLEDFTIKQMKDEKTLQQYKIDEIKYKTNINELNDYIEIYKNKIATLEKQVKDNDKELIELRKNSIKQESDISTLKSILEIFINEYGIENVVEITKLEKSKIESYIEK